MYRLTNKLALDAIKRLGVPNTKSALVLPLATGMSLAVVLVAVRRLTGKNEVLYPRADHKSPMKAISFVGMFPKIIQGELVGDAVRISPASIEEQINENNVIIKSEEDPELVALAQSELSQLQEKNKKLLKELESLIKEKENSKRERSYSAVIMEIRAGTGGEEAALFANDLFRMYSKYANSKGWKMKILDSHPTEIGGFKEIIFEIKNGKEVYDKLKYEGGVHRVQRIPKTEKSGRIHTSTATVAVLPKPSPTEVKIKPQDIKIDSYKASGPGGQYVNKRMTAVRITHLPTGIVVASQTERSLNQNKENALSILAARLFEKKEEEEQAKIAGKRKIQIGQAKRAEKIRTYNFPQDRVTDHRIKKSWHDIEEIMEGEIDEIIEALEKNLNKSS